MADAARDRLGFPAGELRERTTRGALLNGAFVGGGELLLVIQGLVVTAILGPEAIGLYGAVSATAVTITGLKRVGIDEEFVRQSEGEQEEEFQRAFTLDLYLSLALAFVIAAAAPFVALAYGDDRLLALTLAVSYLPVAFSLQAPTWIFFRRMDFLRQRLLLAIVPAVTFAVTVPLVIAGVGVWSLVIGPFVANATAATAAIAVSPYRLRIRRDRATWSRYLRFSWPIFVSVFTLLVVLQEQVLAFDLAEGLAAAGFITLAATLTRYADRVDRGVGLVRLAVRATAPVAGAAAAVVAVRLAFWGGREPLQALAEVALFAGVTAALTWIFERGLLREMGGYLRRAPAPAPVPTA